MMRKLQETDVPDLLVIEAATQSAPWTLEAFQRCLEANYPGWVLEQEGKIIGFIYLSMSTITRECHILNLCISPPSQRQGWGEKLLEFGLDWAKEQGAVMVYLEVRRSNHRAIKLYQKMHFKMIGERKNYYPSAKGGEDALIYARDLGIEDMLIAEGAFPSLNT